MRKLSIYRVIVAYGLLLIWVMPLGIQGLHSWLDEHDKQAHCGSDRGQVHIHDQSYAFDHCFLCAFHFSQYTEQPIPSFIHTPGWITQDHLTEGNILLLKRRISTQTSRGPPALL